MVNFSYLYSNIPISHAHGVSISQLIRYARACSTYDQFLIRGSLLTNKLMSQEFKGSFLQILRSLQQSSVPIQPPFRPNAV
jgi:hypothetical protein